jgi:hypothetical protein
MSASWILNLKKMFLSKAAAEGEESPHAHEEIALFIQNFKRTHKNSSRFSKETLAQFFFQVKKAKCDKNVIFLKRHLMPEMFGKANDFIKECTQDDIQFEVKSIKFKNFLIHSPAEPTTGDQRIHLLLEYSQQECWSDLRSTFQKEQFHDIIEVWELLHSEIENKFYLYWVYDLSSINISEVDHLVESLNAA